MTDNLKINFEELRDGAMAIALDSLEHAFRKFNIDFYLIGAFARDMWMNHISDLPERRTTYDIDFCIYVKSINEYDELKNYLVLHNGWKEDDEPYRLFSKEGIMIDLIPFGDVEKGSHVYLEGDPPLKLSVFGNAEVFQFAQEIQSKNGRFKICTLPGLCILKLISGSEKDTRMQKDFGDFFYILENYFDISGDSIFEAEYDDLIDEDFNPSISAAKMLGRQMKPILNSSDALINKVTQILKHFLDGFDDQDVDQMFKADPKDPKVKRYKLITVLSSELKI